MGCGLGGKGGGAEAEGVFSLWFSGSGVFGTDCCLVNFEVRTAVKMSPNEDVEAPGSLKRAAGDMVFGVGTMLGPAAAVVPEVTVGDVCEL